MPDLSSLYTLNAKWKLKTGTRDSAKNIEMNLPAVYALLILAGLLAVVVIYFFFFHFEGNKALQKNNSSPSKSATVNNAHHYIVSEKLIMSDSVDSTHAMNPIAKPHIIEGTYDKIKKPGESFAKPKDEELLRD